MAIYNWSTLADGDVFGDTQPSFDAGADTLNFDDINLSASEVAVVGDVTTTTLSAGGITVTLDIPLFSATTTNITFADGSLLLIGDNDTGTGGDDGANTLSGGTGDDQLIGQGGNDSLNGAGGADLLDGGDGNDTLSGGTGNTNDSGNDTLIGGTGDDRLIQTGGTEVIQGGDGRDILSFGSGVGPATVDLAAGTSIGTSSTATISGIETVFATAGNDLLIGGGAGNAPGLDNGVAEIFRGNAANDTIQGAAGDGWNTVADYANATNAVTVTLGTGDNIGSASGGAEVGSDTLIYVDQARGGSGNDLLTGGSYARTNTGNFSERFRGNAGDDTIDGQGADNTIGGQGSNDVAEYIGAAAAVYVDLGTGVAQDGLGGTDRLIAIDWVVGSEFNDTLVGGNPVFDEGSERLEGREGDDSLVGVGGTDEANYNNDPGAVVVNLGTDPLVGDFFGTGETTVHGGTARDGWGDTDTLVNIHWARGSDFDDTLVGGANELERLTGAAGDDLIDGGDMTGVNYAAHQSDGAGVNAFIENGIGNATDGWGDVDTLVNINGLWGSNFDDTLTGGDGDQWFRGRGGNDTIDGGAGIDTVSYDDPSRQGVTVDLSQGTARDGWGSIWQRGDGTLTLSGDGEFTLYEVSDPSSAIVGSWVLSQGDGTVVVTFLSGGTYFLAEDGDSVLEPGGQDGMERGTYTWDAGTGAFTFSTDVDTNGDWGLSHSAVDNIIIQGDSLIADDGGELVAFGRAADGPLMGGWRFSDAGEAQSSGVVTFLSDGRYVMVEDGDSGLDPTGQDGVELGTFTWDPNTGAFSSATQVDTSGQWGLSDGTLDTLFINGGLDTLLNIENVEGSDFGDDITGDDGDNVLDGGGGDDTLSGAGGDDTLIGGAGDDLLQGQGGNDLLLVGTGGTGAYGNDTLNGGSGGQDRVAFTEAESGITVNMGNETADGSITGGDGSSTLTLRGIEAVSGTEFADTFNANIGIQFNGLRTDIVQRFEGGAGADSIDAGMNGGFTFGLTIIAEYRDDPDGIIVNLDQQNATPLVIGDETIQAGTARDGYGDVDTLMGQTFGSNLNIVVDGIVGSMHDDYIRGGAFANSIGGNSRQAFEGLGGDDTIDGGHDFGGSTASYESSTAGVIVNLGADTIGGVGPKQASDGFGGTDTLIRIDGVRGSDFNDTLVGGIEDEEHFGGRGGDDYIDGGGHFDNVRYQSAREAVLIDLGAGTAQALDGIDETGTIGVDTLVGIEAAHGSDLADSLLGGGEGAQPFEGMVFEQWEIDLFQGFEEFQGLAGNDTLNGGEDPGTQEEGDARDIAVYRDSPAAVIVNLGGATLTGTIYGDIESNTAADGFGGIDTLIDIDGAEGSRFNDTLVGGDENNYFVGRQGNDSIVGGNGVDWVSYETGNNGVAVSLIGGFATEPQGGPGGVIWVDSLSGIENVVGSDSNDSLLGDGGDNLLAGSEGNDTLVGDQLGGNGNDTLYGGEDNDILRQTRGNDVIDGGEGTGDRLEFSFVDGSASIQYGVGKASVHVDLGAGTSNADRTDFDTVNGGGDGIDGGEDTASVTGIEVVFGTAGHDILTGGSEARSFSDIFLEIFRGRGGNDTIDGAGEGSENVGRGWVDRVEYSDSNNGAVAVNLSSANVSVTGFGTVLAGTAKDGLGGTDTLKNINWVVGSSNNDVLIGGNAANDFFERFEGRGGSDTINGGSGVDDASYIGSPNAVYVDLAAGIAFDGWGFTDALFSIERTRGSNANDTLLGSDRDVLEMFIGEAGDDYIDGRGGIDFVTWRTLDVEVGGVNVTLGTGTVVIDDGLDGEDTLVGIEGLDGSARDDTFSGGDGGDWWFRGRGGNDILNGGDGIDTADYSTDHLGVIVNLGGDPVVVDLGDGEGEATLGGGTARDGFGGIFDLQGIDTISDIENVLGSIESDHITGSSGDNLLDGNSGDDTLAGGDGADTLLGGIGNDSLDGGLGNDVLDGGAGSDVIAGGDGDDLFVDKSGNDELDGGAGADTFLVDYKGGSTTVTATGGSEGDLYVLNPSATGSSYTVTDFVVGEDFIDIGPLLDDSALAGFYSGQAPLTGGFLRFIDSGNGEDKLLQWDRTGASNGAQWVTMITLGGLGGQTLGTNAFLGFIQGGGAAESLGGGDGDDVMLGLGGNDSLLAGTGDDQLFGGTGKDTMRGGAGDDTYHVDNTGDRVFEDNVGGLVLPGSSAGASGLGDIGDTVIAAINYTLGNNVEHLQLFGNASRGTGNALSNEMRGNTGNDTLSGAGGHDTLNGGVGSDSMVGGAGNDVYFVDAAGDVVREGSGATNGVDTVHSSITITKLADNVEHLVLIGTGVIHGTGNTLNNSITGNGKNNRLTGAAGNDTLNGGVGGDTMIGGAGNDLYIVDAGGNKGDKITGETGTGGIDTVHSSVTRGVLEGFVEHIVLTGNLAINATGNGLANRMTGNVNDNLLNGGAGKDTLIGGSGNDTLQGGTGADSMSGGEGNDVYFVDVAGSTGDKVVGETADGGTDAVFSTVTYTLGANLENLGLLGAGNINGSGNGESNVIAGNGGKNTLNGLGGDDVIDGGLEADKLNGGAGNDSLVGGGGNDTLDGGDGDDTLDGGVGADKLNGGADHDVLIWAANDVLDGGDNGDRLVVMGGGADIDLSAANFVNFETIDLTGSGDNRLTVTAGAVLSQSDFTDTLLVEGDDGDEVHIADPTGWHQGGNQTLGDATYHVFTNTNGVTLLVATAVDTTGLP